jgi:hypothetical protein
LRERLYLHNVLRTYLDERIYPGLQDGTGRALEGVNPQGWLPFAEDAPLRRWRDLLAEQLRPGAAARTVEVFAARQGLPPEAFTSLLADEERLDHELFARLPRPALEAYRRELLAASADLLVRYYGPQGTALL